MVTLAAMALIVALPGAAASIAEESGGARTAGGDSAGAAIFANRCALCHGPQAAGIPGSFPSLREQIVAFAKLPQGRDYLVMVVTSGLMGNLKVGDVNYNGVMPAQSGLSEADIAAVLSFLASDLGKNEAAAAALSAADVAGARARHPDQSAQSTRALRPAAEPANATTSTALNATTSAAATRAPTGAAVAGASPSAVATRAPTGAAVTGASPSAAATNAPPGAAATNAPPGAAVTSAAPAAAAGPAGVDNPQRAWQQWTLNCQGCHRPDGTGSTGTAPSLAGTVARFLTVPGGREYLGRVPGVATSPLSNADLSELVNWMLWRFDKEHLPADFQPFTAAEIGQLRGRPLRLEALQMRADLLKKADESATP